MKELFTYGMRFSPIWDPSDIEQVTGLINLVETIFDINKNANLWCEVGVGLGESTSIFLGFQKIHKIHCIDSFSKHENYFDELAFAPEDLKKTIDFDIFKNVFLTRLKDEISNNRCIPIIDSSQNAAKIFDDNFFDVVYIDADHSYEAVKNDLFSYFDKVKARGFLCGHDYARDGRFGYSGKIAGDPWPGVTKAVHELIDYYKLPMPIIFKDSSFLIQKI